LPDSWQLVVLVITLGSGPGTPNFPSLISSPEFSEKLATLTEFSASFLLIVSGGPYNRKSKYSSSSSVRLLANPVWGNGAPPVPEPEFLLEINEYSPEESSFSIGSAGC
jgi:hypothetical protein